MGRAGVAAERWPAIGAIVWFTVLAGCPTPELHYPPGPPAIDRFEVTPFEVRPGTPVSLTWRVRDADEVTLFGLPEGMRAIASEGGLELVALQNLELELVAHGAGGTSRAV